MKEDLYLPLELWREILRRLPIISIIRSKCVCKSWRYLIQGKWGEFMLSYTPKPSLAFVQDQGTGYAVSDEAFQTLFRFSLPPPHNKFPSVAHPHAVIGTVNGLILVWDGFANHCINLFVLNPITREYIDLPPRPKRRSVFGFGVSNIRGEYKIFCGNLSRTCHVYTLSGREEGLWRSIPAATSLPNLREWSWDETTGPTNCLDYAVFLNGKLHWLASDFDYINNIISICCFDLETELFTQFSLPGGIKYGYELAYQLCILDGDLCFCHRPEYPYDNPTNLEHVIWSMKSYGDSKSWLMEYTFYLPILKNHISAEEIYYDLVFPVKVSNGDLVVYVADQLFICSKNVTAYGSLPHRHLCNLPNFEVYFPSFLSLKTMGIHDVKSLI